MDSSLIDAIGGFFYVGVAIPILIVAIFILVVSIII